MRYPCRCGCRVDAQGPPPYWCGVPAGREQGQWRPPPPGGGVQHPVWRRHAGGRPAHNLRQGVGSRVPPPGGSVHCRPPGGRGAGPEGKGTDPQRYPRPQGIPFVACPPRCRLGAPLKGAHAAMAGRSQGLGPERYACLSYGGGRRGASGEDHQGGDRIPQGVMP